MLHRKRFIYRLGILLPIAFAIWYLYDPFGLYIPGIRLTLRPSIFVGLIMGFFSLWILLVPHGEDCRDGTLFQLLYYAVPVELVLLLVFAQYHLLTAVLLVLLCLLLSGCFRLSLRREERRKGGGPELRRLNRSVRRRFFILVTVCVLLTPSLLVLFRYGLDGLVIRGGGRLWVSGLVDPAEKYAVDREPSGGDALMRRFSAAAWEDSSLSQRVDALQLMVDYETRRLGIPELPVEAAQLDKYTLALYDDDAKLIQVDLANLEEAGPERILYILLHEVFHAYQFCTVAAIDWDSAYAGSAYFDELRRWHGNMHEYIHGIDDYGAYKAQPLEASANEYAGDELLRLMSLAILSEEAEETAEDAS